MQAIKYLEVQCKTSCVVALTLLHLTLYLACQTSGIEEPNTDLMQALPAADMNAIDPLSFNDEELDLPYYLAHFHRIANAVVLQGPNSGFINIPVWRRERDNQPYNARIMENILSLAFFYANDRPWNSFYASPRLRFRLESALSFWCDIQSPEGAFSEYGTQKWNLAASAFATKFMGESLHWLENGPAIDKQILQRVVDADRKTIHHVLTDSAFYAHGVHYSNQFSNVWAGALAFLHLHPDEEIRSLLMHRLQQSMSSFQSTAGYFYEANGPDWSYNLGTHHSNLHMAFHYAKDPKIKEMLARKERAFSEWLAYNSVPDPDVDEYFVNRGIECRQLRSSFERYGWMLSQGMPLTTVDSLSRAFTLDQDEAKTVTEEVRTQLLQKWPMVDSLPLGDFNAFSPYAFLYRNHDRYYPTATERQSALVQLPINRSPFIHQRYDSRNQTVYTFIKMPSYYAVFNSGQKVRDQQRFGLGLLWTAPSGVLLQSQTKSTHNAWGTRFHSDSLPIEGADLDAQFFVANEPIRIKAGNHDILGQNLSISYSLGETGMKKLTFLPDRIHVVINYPGPFIEHLPLLIAADQSIKIQNGKVVHPSKVQFKVKGSTVSIAESTHVLSASKHIALIEVKAQNELSYDVLF